MRILFIGDIVGKAGRQAVSDHLADVQALHKIDFTIINAENSAGGSGVTARIANNLFRLGADALTMGDHVWDRPEIVEYFSKERRIIRPANFPDGTPGPGWQIYETRQGIKVGVINLLGRTFMRYNVECPFRTLEKAVKILKAETSVICVDFHAETTSEKVALGFFADGMVSAVVGTHTHIQTADETIHPKGTAYITDLGMTGPYDSVIGQNKETIIRRFLTSMPSRFEVAKDGAALCGVVVDVDEKTGCACKITRIQRRTE